MTEDVDSDYLDVMRRSFASRYMSKRDVWTTDQALRTVTGRALTLIERSPAYVLDLGVGRGVDSTALLNAGHRVIGIDLIETPEARSLCNSSGGRFTYKIGDFLSQSVAVGGVDLCLDNGSFHHQPASEHDAYLTAIYDWLRPRGYLVLSVCTPDCENSQTMLWRDPDGRIAYMFAPDDLSVILSRNRFRVVDSFRIARTDTFSKFFLVNICEAA